MAAIESPETVPLKSQFWNSIPSQWHLIGSPLRPGEQDEKIILEVVDTLFGSSGSTEALNALLLGVTPEIAVLDWPKETRLTAVDRAPGMISVVWPGNSTWRTVACADWLSLPFPDESFDFVVGDGCLVLLEYPMDYRRLASSLRQCIRQSGELLLRIFCRPARSESVEEVFHDLRNHAIGSFDAFKWRLIMAVQGEDVSSGALLADVWNVWHSCVPDPEAFARDQGWSVQKVQVIDAYRDNPNRYHYPTLDEVCQAFGHDFDMAWSRTGSYELAERCPHVLFRPK